MFAIEKILAAWLMPLPLGVALCITGLLLLWFSHRQILGKLISTAGVVVLVIGSNAGIANALVKSLENDFSVFKADPGQEPEYIIVLGDYHHNDQDQPISSQIGGDGLKRLVEGIAIHRQFPESKLVLSGYSRQTGVPYSNLVAAMATDLGVSAEHIITEPAPRDTAEEAQYIKNIVGDAPCILVTSASHMSRAVRLFAAQGIHPVPAPTAFRSEESVTILRPPSDLALGKTRLAVHEYLGMAWSRLGGEI